MSSGLGLFDRFAAAVVCSYLFTGWLVLLPVALLVSLIDLDFANWYFSRLARWYFFIFEFLIHGDTP